ncbi:hypothetical protein MMYC01_206976 [Madurella mycetomatis]|uniref:Uncharacterized protein n=1 Tax=Madurella mycetomatis TaxID=100816 RepID=A0A175W2Q0_9PEZI|nr:hypothetical protein MMYC01_206976 [Madurella mycetomatis]
MRFQSLLFILLTSLVSSVCGELSSVRSNLKPVAHAYPRATERGNGVHLSKRAGPTLPEGEDDSKLHVWLRLDTRPSTYDNRKGAEHDGLNQLMKDTGGRHVDVVVGNSKGYKEYGLQFKDKEWQTKPNGDGAEIMAYSDNYQRVTGERFTYQGQVRDGRKTLNSISTVG